MEELDILDDQPTCNESIDQHEIVEAENIAKIQETTETYTIEEADDNTVKFNRSFKQESMDSDEKFLLSLAPSMRRLPVKKNTMARIRIQQLLFEMEYDEKYD